MTPEPADESSPATELLARKPKPPSAAVAVLRGMLVLALFCVIVGPVALNSFGFTDWPISRLIVQTCTVSFGSLLGLWFLDATNFLPFRHDWMSRVILRTAILTILGAGAAFFADYLRTGAHPNEGFWDVTVVETYASKDGGEPWHNKRDFEVALRYSPSAGAYRGISNVYVNKNVEPADVGWLSIVRLDFKQSNIEGTWDSSAYAKANFSAPITKHVEGERIEAFVDDPKLLQGSENLLSISIAFARPF